MKKLLPILSEKSAIRKICHLVIILVIATCSTASYAQIATVQYPNRTKALKNQRDSLNNIVSPQNVELTNLVKQSAQQIDAELARVERYEKDLGLDKEEKQMELLSRGFVDYFNSGSVQASAQLLKIRIGEPKLFSIPFYIFVGASGDNLGDGNENNNTISTLLNPTGGLLNSSISKEHEIFSTGDYTYLMLSYQLSGKLISGKNAESQENELFAAGYGNFGLYFQTGAWEEMDKSNVGVFWMQTKLIGTVNRTSDMNNLFGDELGFDNYSYGYAADLALEINNKLNIKASVYQFLNNESIDGFDDPVFKFSFDHKLK